MRPRDTDPKAWEHQMELFRRMGPQGRGQAAAKMIEDSREITRQGIAQRHPNYSSEELTWALHRVLLGDQLFRTIWPHRPLLEG